MFFKRCWNSRHLTGACEGLFTLMRVVLFRGFWWGPAGPFCAVSPGLIKSERCVKMGKDQGATRSLGELGHAVIPGDIRDAFGWGADTRLEVMLKNISIKSVTIREAFPRCSLCRQEAESLTKVEQGYICPQCAIRIA